MLISCGPGGQQAGQAGSVHPSPIFCPPVLPPVKTEIRKCLSYFEGGITPDEIAGFTDCIHGNYPSGDYSFISEFTTGYESFAGDIDAQLIAGRCGNFCDLATLKALKNCGSDCYPYTVSLGIIDPTSDSPNDGHTVLFWICKNEDGSWNYDPYISDPYFNKVVLDSTGALARYSYVLKMVLQNQQDKIKNKYGEAKAIHLQELDLFNSSTRFYNTDEKCELHQTVNGKGYLVVADRSERYYFGSETDRYSKVFREISEANRADYVQLWGIEPGKFPLFKDSTTISTAYLQYRDVYRGGCNIVRCKNCPVSDTLDIYLKDLILTALTGKKIDLQKEIRESSIQLNNPEFSLEYHPYSHYALITAPEGTMLKVYLGAEIYYNFRVSQTLEYKVQMVQPGRYSFEGTHEKEVISTR